MKTQKAVNRVCKNVSRIPVLKRRGKNVTMYMCTTCKYESNRHFNVQRHQRRIHENRKLRTCCGTEFITKGEYYIHCEKIHPEKRSQAIMSKFKYKMTEDSMNDHERVSNSCNVQLKSTFLQSIRLMGDEEQTESKVSLEYSLTCNDFDVENAPLITFLTDRQSMPLLKKWSSTNSANETEDKSRGEESNRTVEIAISSEGNIEGEVAAKNVQNIRAEVSTTSVSVLSRELPTKKLILQRFRSDLMHKFEIPLMERKCNHCSQTNFEAKTKGKENTENIRQDRKKNFKRSGRKADKENASAFEFSLEQELSVRLDTGIAGPVVTQLHRDFLSTIDFDQYKIF